ncbi:MAG: YeeE/YedE family protein [Deltaproteobacteria bacterium]|nr:YeeE/YedE family protein [Deltaproteobacteria bacterium]
MDLVFGMATGIIFGFLLQKGRVLRFEKQIGFLRLIDMTIIKFMLSAILVGMVGIYLCYDLGMIQLDVKSTVLGAQIIGGLMFGVGWAIFGFCPGTAAGALGEGRIHALWGIFGMLAGAALYAEAYPELSNTLLKWGVIGKVTLPELLQVNHWVVIGGFFFVIIAFFVWCEKKKL